jgi:predicted transcriptional regulator
MATRAPTSEWSEERLRYTVLRSIYERVGADCAATTTATQIGAELSIGYEELFRTISALVQHGYLFEVAEGPRVCITPRGIRYIEKAAGRRMTIRLTPPTQVAQA